MSKSQYEEIVVALQAANPAIEAGQMFGMPTLKVGRKAFAGLFNGEMVFKWGGSDHAAALRLSGAHQFYRLKDR